MAVTWNNLGAAVEVIELNSPDYRALEDRSGYLGYLALINIKDTAGALVRVVAPGTPAARAGLQTDDLIVALDNTRLRTAEALIAALALTKPGQQIALSIVRSGVEQKLTATLVITRWYCSDRNTRPGGSTSCGLATMTRFRS